MPPMIRFENVTFAYKGGPPILSEFSLSVARGERICIMGSNGCGKSTLALIIAGLLKASQGTVTIDGNGTSGLISQGSPAGRVGLLFQNPDNQMVAAEVDKEIAFSLENAAVPAPEMEQRIADTTRQFRIEHLARRLTSELSGGEKQRVALASVMVERPPILVLDEPDSFLDEAGKRILHDELTRLRQDNPDLTEVRITQYRQVAREYPRLVVVHQGQVVADNQPEAILSNRSFCERVGLWPRESKASVPYGSFKSEERQGISQIREVELTELSIGYSEDSIVLSDLNWTFRRGEIVGLIGPTGSGKSSLGLTLCGLLPPLSGRISLHSDGEAEVAASETRGKIVGLFQQPERQFFLPACAEEIAFGPANFERQLDPSEIDDLFQLVELDPQVFRKRNPFSLSMGEKRRLAFAALLSMNPPFIIFDEPTCGLDPEGVGRFIQLSRRLRENGVGQIIISHDGDVIRALADRVLYLKGDKDWAELRVPELAGNSSYSELLSTPEL